MFNPSAQERDRLLREKTRKAVALAMHSRWEEAVELNEAMLADFPETEDVLNRLGRAFFELGRYDEATKAFQRALDVAPLNAIARRNLEKLEALDGQERPIQRRQRISGPRFIEESGKTGRVRLQEMPSKKTLATLAAGDPVMLCVEDGILWVKTPDGEPLGRPDPPMSARLTRLIEGGNTYDAALTSVSQRGVALLVRETYRHPNQSAIRSFPSHAAVFQPLASDGSSSLDSDAALDHESLMAPLVAWSDNEEGRQLAEDAVFIEDDDADSHEETHEAADEDSSDL